ncbi:hypothetical protein HMPREF3198_01173 [Winkia neuii]|nr:hypothetical protein HMPREF3198_01173 [Winkia neuii]
MGTPLLAGSSATVCKLTAIVATLYLLARFGAHRGRSGILTAHFATGLLEAPLGHA